MAIIKFFTFTKILAIALFISWLSLVSFSMSEPAWLRLSTSCLIGIAAGRLYAFDFQMKRQYELGEMAEKMRNFYKKYDMDLK